MKVPTLNEFLENSPKYVKRFPLIIACTIPVMEKEDVYKPEYILPQLVLEWVISKQKQTEAIGVYYTSVFRNQQFFPMLDTEWDNLAIPAQKPLEKTYYCPELKELFKLTKPTCYEYEHMLGNIDATGFWDNGPERLTTGDDTKSDYYCSTLSRLEEHLLKKKVFDYVDVEDPE